MPDDQQTQAQPTSKSITARYGVQTCEKIGAGEKEQTQVVLNPVTAEGKMDLWNKTPTGHIHTLVTNRENADYFQHGGLFDVTFTPVVG